jgi:5'(3')-deoxyribonucleotidase
MIKPIVHVDMDGVLVDLADAIVRLPAEVRERYGEDVDEVPGLFDDPPPIRGAVEALTRLVESDRLDIHVLSTAPWGNPSAWTAKRLWMERYFGDMFEKRITLTHRKNWVSGDFLIDDRPNNGAEEFSGEWIQFGVAPFDTWEQVVKYLLADGFYWLGGLGAHCSESELRDSLIHHWLDKGGQTKSELPTPLVKSVISFSKPSPMGGVSVPDIAHGPHVHPYNPNRMVSWIPADLELPADEWRRIAKELGVPTMEFVPSPQPHVDVKFLNQALKLLMDVNVFQEGDGVGRFKTSFRKSKKFGTTRYRGGAALPVVPSQTLTSHYLEFLNAEVAYVFTSSGPTLSSRKTLHMAHRIDGDWVLGKKLNEYLS